MGWGASAPPPDPAIGQAEQLEAQTAAQAQQFYQTNVAPAELQQMQQQTQIAGQEASSEEALQSQLSQEGQTYYNQYESTYVPLQNQLISQAEQYNSPQWQELQAGQAASDVEQAYSTDQAGLQRQLTAQGINPGSGNAIAAQAGLSSQEGLARAQAINSTRQAARTMGWNYLTQAESMGSGLPGASLGASTASGNAGMNAVAAQGSGLNAVSQVNSNNNQTASTVSNAASSMGNLGVQNSELGLNAAQINNGPINSVLGAATGALMGFGMLAAMKGSGDPALSGKWNGTNFGGTPSDRRLKRSIRRIGRTDYGLPIYTFKYKGGDGATYMGVMADEAEKVRPHAVYTGANGFKMVRYDCILDP